MCESIFKETLLRGFEKEDIISVQNQKSLAFLILTMLL